MSGADDSAAWTLPPDAGDWQAKLGERGFRFTHPRGQFGGPSSGFAVPDGQVPEIAAMVSAVMAFEQYRAARSQPHGPWLIQRRPEWRPDWTVLLGPVIVQGTDGPGWGPA